MVPSWALLADFLGAFGPPLRPNVTDLIRQIYFSPMVCGVVGRDMLGYWYLDQDS